MVIFCLGLFFWGFLFDCFLFKKLFLKYTWETHLEFEVSPDLSHLYS